MTARQLTCWGLVALAGAGLGARLVVGLGQARALQAPETWSRTEMEVPFRRPDLTGALGLSPRAHALDHFEGLQAPAPTTRLDLDLTLPTGSSATLWFGPAETAPPGLALRPSDGRVQLVEDNRFQPRCTGGVDLEPGRHAISVTTAGQQIAVAIGDQSLVCSGVSVPERAPVLASGLRRIHVHGFAGDGFALPPPLSDLALVGGGLIGALAAVAVVAVELATGASLAGATASTLPWLLAWFVLRSDGYLLVENVRLAGFDPAHIPALWVGLAGAVPKLLHAAGRVARSRFHLAAPLLPAIVLASSALLLRPRWPISVGFGALAAGLVGLIVWANVRTVRGFNLVSLAAFAGAMVLSEQAVRFTETGVAWSRSGTLEEDPVLGWTRTAVSEFEALERGDYTDYPVEGYPVDPGLRQGRPRLVAFGGSSTGGAFQNDDLNAFYPARIEELFGGRLEVVNQGVGGWSTFHIAEYADRRLEAMTPAIVTVYVGHNDGFTRVSQTYRDMYAAWRGGSELGRARSGPDLRLLNGLGFLVRAMLPREMTVAVPVDHARDNLEVVIERSKAAGAKVVLASEGINPDPGALVDYWEMMEALATEHDHVTWLDTATMLRSAGDGMFMDDCHLSEAGHRLVAGAFKERLEELAWVP